MKPKTLDRLLICAGIVVVLLVNGLFSYWQNQTSYSNVTATRQAQARRGAIVEQRLCATFELLAKDQPPAGSAATNPSRAYLQELHARLGEVPGELGCTPGTTRGK